MDMWLESLLGPLECVRFEPVVKQSRMEYPSRHSDAILCLGLFISLRLRIWPLNDDGIYRCKYRLR